MTAVKTLVHQFLREEDAATMIEYALLAVLIAMVVAIAAITLGRAISTQFGNVTNCVSNPSNTTCTPP
jgi:pilus assembly protein Flp/PilA